MTRIAIVVLASALLGVPAAAGQCPAGTKPVEERHPGTTTLSKRGCMKPLPNGKQSREGHWVEYYESGAKKSDTYWKDDKKQGLSTWYYESGAKMWEYTYKDDKMEGPSAEYAEDGKVVTRAVYKNDNLVKQP